MEKFPLVTSKSDSRNRVRRADGRNAVQCRQPNHNFVRMRCIAVGLVGEKGVVTDVGTHIVAGVGPLPGTGHGLDLAQLGSQRRLQLSVRVALDAVLAAVPCPERLPADGVVGALGVAVVPV